jgi:amino acid permease
VSVRFRPLTGLVIAIAVALVAHGVVYFTIAAGNLPAFFPGHLKGSAHHHVKHGLACLTLAVAALIGAWFTTALSTGSAEPLSA